MLLIVVIATAVQVVGGLAGVAIAKWSLRWSGPLLAVAFAIWPLIVVGWIEEEVRR